MGHCLPRGRPILIEPGVREKISEYVQNAQDNTNTVSEEQFRKILFKGRAVTAEQKRGLSVVPTAEVVTLSDADVMRTTVRYTQNYLQREGLSCARPDRTTVSRDTACKCPFMSYVWYIVNEAIASTLPATQKWNADATTYEFKSREVNAKAIFYKEDPNSFRRQKSRGQ